MSDLLSLLELSQIKAIGNAIDPTLESIWQLKCREYSKTFHTPLHVVLDLDPELVLDSLYAEKYGLGIEDSEIEDLLEILYKIKDPTYSKISREEMEAMVDMVINKETARLKKQKVVETSLPGDKPIEINPVKPQVKSGGMNFADLEKQEAGQELNGEGFEEA